MTGPGSRETEEDLLRRAQQGDETALDHLLRLWQPSLEAIARSLHRRHSRLGFDTHDLVATTIRRLLRMGPGGVDDAAGRALLKRILHRAYVDKVREEVSRQRRQAEAARSAPRHDERPALTDHDSAPPSLKPDEWELVLLWKQGLSWSQISDHLGVPAETARRRWHRLMARLRGSRAADQGEAVRESGSAREAHSAEPAPSDQAEDPDPPRDPAA